MEDHAPATSTLLEKTLELLEDCPYTMPELYMRTGVSFYWIRKFKTGTMRNPSVVKVQTLYEFLTGRTLEV
jgi:hypothetical protein